MDIINQIGHPYLTHNGLLSTYKRIKKKDYKKIQQKQFRQFYETSQKISENELIENEKRIYLEKVKKKCQFINALEKVMKLSLIHIQMCIRDRSSQITLLQIPLSYMLETGYDAEKIINLMK